MTFLKSRKILIVCLCYEQVLSCVKAIHSFMALELRMGLIIHTRPLFYFETSLGLLCGVSFEVEAAVCNKFNLKKSLEAVEFTFCHIKYLNDLIKGAIIPGYIGEMKDK
jgi:hypothetical protein